jgi:hypothetical protein
VYSNFERKDPLDCGLTGEKIKLKHIDTANRDIFPSVIALFFSVTRYCFTRCFSCGAKKRFI